MAAGKKTSERGTVVEWMMYFSTGYIGLLLQTVAAGKKTSERGTVVEWMM